MNSNTIIIALAIFFIRITDVSLGTLRIIFVSRGIRIIAALCGFFEVLIWLFAISQIMQNLTNYINYFAYAGGFGMGTFLGISIERALYSRTQLIRIITSRDASELLEALTSKGYGLTSVAAQGSRGPVEIIFSIVDRARIQDIINIINQYNPQAFYTVEDIRYVNEACTVPFPASPWKTYFNRFNQFIKRK
ncbi:MAG: DUF2179 domain-containing protein [Elusimicrobia bacterium]|nr:DUF2179 domain-containing protein [Elusimicrobiota bacterium]MBD3412417.1 DUF2179 domain-containing protein [Elusimicrobiota bacterium]